MGIALIIRRLFRRPDLQYAKGLWRLDEEHEQEDHGRPDEKNNKSRIDRFISYLMSLREKANQFVESEEPFPVTFESSFVRQLPSSLYVRWLLECAILYAKSLKSRDQDE